MSNSSSQSLLLAMAICSCVVQPAFSQGSGPTTGAPAPSATGPQGNVPALIHPQAQKLQQMSQQTPQFSPSTSGTPPTLGQVLDQEALNQQAQPGYAAQGYAPQGNSPQGYAPQGYKTPGFVQARPGIGGLINDIRGLVKDVVQVDLQNAGGENVKVRVPFVNVDVNNGQPNVKVNSPFVKVNKSSDGPVSVKAPFVNVSPQGQTNP